ncbi:peroxidase 15-like [Hevea brasiliensis]|uniref:peroxidase 15-like n=1 Tax=Hevea brasiliensis TaxID=3981 RepID=UPI0025D287D5|nr:peroxidase 15-like [Hevea brasiliensis]
MNHPCSLLMVVAVLVYAILVGGQLGYAQLTPTFYGQNCPNVSFLIREVIQEAMLTDPRIDASLIRLHFHDCFVNGCDTSILLDTTNTMKGEKEVLGNKNSARGFDVVDKMKARLETECPGTVYVTIIILYSFTNVIKVAGRRSTNLLRRRDSLTANRTQANINLPSPFASLDELKANFTAVGLNTTTDLVVLSGAHSFREAQCRTFRGRIYNSPELPLNSTYNATLSKICSQNGTTDDNLRTQLDSTTPNVFDNKYFSNLQFARDLLESDQVLFSTPDADTIEIVNNFIAN